MNYFIIVFLKNSQSTNGGSRVQSQNLVKYETKTSRKGSFTRAAIRNREPKISGREKGEVPYVKVKRRKMQ